MKKRVLREYLKSRGLKEKLEKDKEDVEVTVKEVKTKKKKSDK